MKARRDRRSTPRLPWDEWLTAWWGAVEGGRPDLLFSGPNGPDRQLLRGLLCMTGCGHTPRPGVVLLRAVA